MELIIAHTKGKNFKQIGYDLVPIIKSHKAQIKIEKTSIVEAQIEYTEKGVFYSLYKAGLTFWSYIANPNKKPSFETTKDILNSLQSEIQDFAERKQKESWKKN